MTEGFDVFETVRDAVKTALLEMDYDISELADDMVLGPAGLDLESLAVAELAVHIEDDFGVKFADEELPGMADLTLDEFSALVVERMGATSAAGLAD
ncbi:phosphopantetheine-binding protein [Actinacidiphila epipremni]|jgi:acyl carrier protein|uniref:Acyl carrier protein n=1 Tax=Actinacidiphila epipremni TaxID=2053013 RepID=A0ABX0ZMJ7_9ACTN|nr:phosphopantetheine-binding protein [Actinacidiphila epipremni]NJP43946.1 acyl carrier protein [Actinacidiphila epipremni]